MQATTHDEHHAVSTEAAAFRTRMVEAGRGQTGAGIGHAYSTPEPAPPQSPHKMPHAGNDRHSINGGVDVSVKQKKHFETASHLRSDHVEASFAVRPRTQRRQPRREPLLRVLLAAPLPISPLPALAAPAASLCARLSPLWSPLGAAGAQRRRDARVRGAGGRRQLLGARRAGQAAEEVRAQLVSPRTPSAAACGALACV